MSNKTLSPSSDTATGITRGQATKLVEMTEHGLLKSPVFKGVPTEKVDEFVKGVGPKLREAFVAMVEARFEAFTGRHIIPVDYDSADAINAAITENDFGSKYVSVDTSKIPLGGTGQVDEEVHEVHFGKRMYNRDLPEALKQRGVESGFKLGFKFANFLTALKFALKHPGKQLEYPLVILFYDVNGQLCYLYLYEDDGERDLSVNPDNPGDYWRDYVRFLAVPVSEPLAA